MKKICKLSIAMIVKNEEWILEKCLESLTLLDDKIDYEIVIVDTGSEDNTINIAKKYTNNIYMKKWNNNFADMRNYSISKCTGEWILIIDADEILENPNDLINFLKDKNNDKINASTLKIKNIIKDEREDYSIIYSIRLFKNRKEFFYKGRIHEQPNVLSPLILTNISLLHYGYSRDSFKLMKYKYERNLKLLLEDLKENNNDPYIYFQLAQTYKMANINDKAFENILKAYNLIKDRKNEKNYLYIHQMLAMITISTENYERTIEICKKAILYNKNNLDFYYYICKAYVALKKYDEAKIYYNEYFKLHEKIENGYIDRDISLASVSFSYKKNMLEDMFVITFNEKDYKYILDNYRNYTEDNLEYIFIYTFIFNKEYNLIFEYYKNREIEDRSIDNIISSCEKINKETFNDNIIDIYINLLGLDSRLDNYINYIYMYKKLNKINLEKCCIYKLRIFNKNIIEDKENIEQIKHLNKNDIYNYLLELTKDYRGIEVLYKYSQEKILTNNITNLSFILIIEDILIKNENIEKRDYNELIYRYFINKINYIRKIYNNNILNEYYNNICNRDEKFFIELLNIFKLYSIDKYNYVKKIKVILREYPEYKILIDYLKDDIIINDIDYNIILKEKENLISNIEILIQNNKIQEAKEILEEIKDIFKYDNEINNLLGVISYLETNYKNSLIYFGLANIFKEYDFDSSYNLYLILKELNRIEDSKFYYQKAIELCNDEEIKNELIKNNI